MPGTHREAPTTREVSNAVTSCFTDTKTEILRQVDDFNTRLDQVQQSQDREAFIGIIRDIYNSKVGYLFYETIPHIPAEDEEPQWDFRFDRQAAIDVAMFVQGELSRFLTDSVREFASIQVDSRENPPPRIFGMDSFSNMQRAYAMLVAVAFNEVYATPVPEGYEAPAPGSELAPLRRNYDESGIDSGKFRAYVEARVAKYRETDSADRPTGGSTSIYEFSQAASPDVTVPYELYVKFPPYLFRTSTTTYGESDFLQRPGQENEQE